MEVTNKKRVSQIRQDRQNCYHGTFLVHLDGLEHKTTDSDDKTVEECRIQRLLDIFDGEECRSDESENRIAAVIERSVFTAALRIAARATTISSACAREFSKPERTAHRRVEER